MLNNVQCKSTSRILSKKGSPTFLIPLKMKQLFLFLGCLLILSKGFSQESIGSSKSPSGNITIDYSIIEQQLVFDMFFGDEQLFRRSELGIVFRKEDSLVHFELLDIKQTIIDETWQPIWGQYSTIRNNYYETLLFLKDIQKDRLLNIRFRIYDDGFAFRYEYPDITEQLVIEHELSSFCFTENNISWWIWADYNTLEKLYNHTNISEAQHVATPFTVKTSSGTYISIHEANIDNYSSMTLKKMENDSLSFRVHLVPNSNGSAVVTSGPFVTPWRAVMVSSDAGGLIESSMILNLNDPAPDMDYSWIQPIRYVGIWWEMHLGLSEWGMENQRHGATTENAKKYIDFASENGIEAVLIEGWNTGWENWGIPGAFDFITPYPDFRIREIVEYARTKNVEIIGHHETGGDVIAYEHQLEKAFAFYQSIGIHYVKTGYAGPVNPPTENHHGQYMVNHYNTVMKMAMKYEIMLDVHEPIIPSGLSRTYPNLMTFEGVRGMEWNAWSEGNPPSHTCIVPFTRGLAGPIDYTGGIFDITLRRNSEKRQKWNGLDNGNTSVHSTLSNQIALLIILFSPMQMFADLPVNYSDHPAFHFAKQIPATWDTTMVLQSEIGEYIIMARRSEETWFVAGITNEQTRDFLISFDFLKPHLSYVVTLCKDVADTHFEYNPETYEIIQFEVNYNKVIQLNMASGGGFVMIIKPSE